MDRITKYLAISMLGMMFILLFASAWNDSAIMDELPHIPAGYSYLTQRDYRLNPEHPPLIKSLSALPLLLLNINFPTDIKEWKEGVNDQWNLGRIFLYESGNNADRILRFSRFPIMLLAILFGWLFFKWARGLYGNRVGLLALFFFTLSPTFLAHSRYVTTDLGAAFGFFIGMAAFLNFLSRPSKKNLIIAGIAFGIAQLLKFSLMMLAPLYLILGGLWVLLNRGENRSPLGERFSIKLFGKIFLIGLIGLILIWLVYLFHIWQYPIEKQLSDTAFTLRSFPIRPLADLTVWLSGIPILRALGQYMLGLIMVLQRAAGGNTAYFLGEVTNVGWHGYFPLLYLLKEHLAFHLLTLLALVFGICNIIKSREKDFRTLLEWLRENFVLTASFIFIGIYWLQSILTPLNIGVRHVLPTFPFIYLLVSRQIIRWIKEYTLDMPSNFYEWVKRIYQIYIRPTKRFFVLTLFLVWMFISTIINFPYYVSYYNELAGTTCNGYKVAVDSNYDWGQDLKRLNDFVEENNIQKIAVDYFGGGNPQYYFGEKFEPWWSSRGPLRRVEDEASEIKEGWFAVSLTFLQEAHAQPVKGFTKKLEDAYPWLKNQTQVARAGTSIFIYKF